MLNSNGTFIVSHQVVVEFQSSWLFVSQNNISDFEEEI
jgi:hypothetical protein